MDTSDYYTNVYLKKNLYRLLEIIMDTSDYYTNVYLKKNLYRLLEIIMDTSDYYTNVYLKKNLSSSSDCGAISRWPVAYVTRF